MVERPDDRDDAGSDPGMPRWVKVFGLVALVVVALVVVLLIVQGPGGHGPSRHMPAGELGGTATQSVPVASR